MNVKIKGKNTKIEKSCLHGYALRNHLAQGGWSTVYQTCNLKNDCNYAIKIQKLPEIKIEGYLEEVCMSKILNREFNIGPKFIGAWMCNDNLMMDKIGIIVTEKWDGELKYSDKLSKTLIDKLAKQIEIIHEIGFIHGDILPKNIFVKKNKSGKINDVTLADFGTIGPAKEWKDNDANTRVFYQYHKASLLNIKPNYYNDLNITEKAAVTNPHVLDKGLLYYLQNK